jgi:alkylation response protein AidB-like acyl-CoA dehydrogenase
MTPDPHKDARSMSDDVVSIACRLADERLAPLAASVDRDGTFSSSLWDELFAFGLAGIPFPTEFGGGGGSYLTYCDVIEAISRRAAVATTYHAPAVLVSTALIDFASAEIARRLVPELLAGRSKACWAFTEPQTGSDPRQIETRAERSDGEWIINGAKMFITLAPLADFALVFAATGEGRLSAILVDTDQPGWQPGPPIDLLAFGGAATAPVFLDDVRAPASHLVGDEGQGFDIMLRVEAAGKIRAAATTVGIAQRAQELAVGYALDRSHRGQSIGRKFQTIQWLLGEIGANVEAARALTREVARRHDRGESIGRLAASARIIAARTARTVTSDALQVFGSYGMVRGSEIERLYREGKFFEVGQGVIELQRLIVARELMAERA